MPFFILLIILVLNFILFLHCHLKIIVMKHFIDLDLKRIESDEFSFDLHPDDSNNHYYLRFRFFYSDGSGSEYEFWYPTLSSCITKLIQLLCCYSLGIKS